ncbi:MAG: hypothetical protein AABX11_05280 [Nanoarchaeota archaeon]
MVEKITSKQEHPHPEKAASRVSINALMMGSLFFILTIIWTLNPERFSIAIVTQLVFAVPLFLVSSLCYSKVGYWARHEALDRFGWITNTLGNILVLNVVGIMTSTLFKNIAFIYFGLLILLMGTYYLIVSIYQPHTIKERIIKFIFFLLIVFFGGILQVI